MTYQGDPNHPLGGPPHRYAQNERSRKMVWGTSLSWPFSFLRGSCSTTPVDMVRRLPATRLRSRSRPRYLDRQHRLQPRHPSSSEEC